MAEQKIFRELDDKREEMVEFLLENIVAEETERIGNDVIAVPHSGTPIFVKTFSKQSDFEYEFEPDHTAHNNELIRLKAIKEAFAKMICQLKDGEYLLGYKRELIPAFVFLSPEVDRKQLKERTEQLINHGHFLKQELTSNPNFYNLARLDPLEVALMYFHRFEREKKDLRSGSARNFMPGLTYYNPEQHKLRAVYFADSANPAAYANDQCVICGDLNGLEFDHSVCKEGPNRMQYVAFVQRRDRALFHKYWMTAKTRKEKVKGSKSSENGVIFRPLNVDTARLKLDEQRDDLYIAVVK